MESNDPLSPIMNLAVTANIEVEFDFETSFMRFDVVNKDVGATKTNRILIKNPDETRIDSIVTSSRFVTAKLVDDPANFNPGKRELEIKLLPGLPLGNMNESIAVYSNLSGKPRLTLNVNANVIGDVRVDPMAITFVISDSGTVLGNKLYTVKIESYMNGKNLEILGVTDSDSLLDITKKTITDGHDYNLEITPDLKKLPEEQRREGHITISTNSDVQKNIDVTYLIVRRR